MAANNDTRFYIDGQWQDRSGATRIAVVDPSSERIVGHVAAGSPTDVDLAVAAARWAFDRFSRTSAEERLALLGRILELLKERAELFAQTLVTEMGAAGRVGPGFPEALSHVPERVANEGVQALT